MLFVFSNRFVSCVKDLIFFLPSRSVYRWKEVSRLENNAPTVILIAGFGAPSRPVSILQKRLLRDRYNVIAVSMDALNLSGNVSGLYRMALHLEQLVMEIREKLPSRPIYLVGYSAGGLVARYYIQQRAGHKYCQSLITLGTPHHGTWFALLGLLTHLVTKARCLFQMLPFSRFIRDLNRAPFPENFPFVSIYSDQDLLCRPVSAELHPNESESAAIKNIKLGGCSHSDFLLSKKTYRLIRESLLTDDIFAAVDS